MTGIDNSLLTMICDVFADTNKGLKGLKIIEICNKFAVKYEVSIPNSFKVISKSKRTMLLENLQKFNLMQQLDIIKHINNIAPNKESEKAKECMSKLYKKYETAINSNTEKNEYIEYIEETKHWLNDFEKSYKSYIDGISKYKACIFERNILDDMRLSLEYLLKEILSNDKSLENQKIFLGEYLKDCKISKYIINMYQQILAYYCNYNNENVKHEENINDLELSYIIELTTVMMRFLIRCHKGSIIQ